MKPINEMTILELKALCYDQMRIFEQTKNNLNVINQEIAKKEKEEDGAEQSKA